MSVVKNRDVFLVDPLSRTILNDGVAKVLEPKTTQEWDVLRYELENFVCEGEYYQGMERILSAYLTHINRAEQPAVWVSGFYGSGKSHFVRVLEYLWRDIVFPDGATARGITNLPSEIRNQLRELSTIGKREGGLWSAAGTLSGSAIQKDKGVRLSMLGILFRSAGLPDQYAPARLMIWLKQNGYYDPVKTLVERQGRELSKELLNMYVSPVLAESLLVVYPHFASSPAEVRSLLKVQYPNREDISDEELLLTMEDVLALQATTPGKAPCTLLVFDELQQFIGEDPMRTLQVQTLVEACSSRFGSKLLFVATGQAALQATTQLSKLQGRFTVRVTLSDTDVERVVREVVLRKADAQKPVLKAMLDATSGEIDRQLVGTKIGPRQSDAAELMPDYPLLPVRRRFWERVLRAVDSAGTAGQLRTQLKIVHEAVKAVAERPLGTVVAADFIFEQLRQSLLQSSVLERDMDTIIANQRNEANDGELRARICALIFLISRINKFQSDGPLATDVQADAQTLADLLADDLVAGSADLRQRIPRALSALAEAGVIMQVGEEYRLQTGESLEWESDYRTRQARILADESRIASDRTTELRTLLTEQLRGLSLTQGVTKTPRKFELSFDLQQPTANGESVPVWVRDEWSVSERNVRDDAQVAGVDSPLIFVFLPKHQPDALKRALAAKAAAKETLDARPRSPKSDEARSGMEARLRRESNTVSILITETIKAARIFQGGGHELNEGSLTVSLRSAIEAALVRLFPEFSATDNPGWSTVVARAAQGAADALAAVGYQGDVDKHPVCKQIRDWIGGSAKRGIDIRKRFQGTPYGWPQDAVDGTLFVLIGGGFVRASRNGKAAILKELPRGQIGVHDFVSEGITVTAGQRLLLRKLLQALQVPFKQGEEANAIPLLLQQLTDLARAAGGAPPLPVTPSLALIDTLRSYSGNQLVIETVNRVAELEKDFTAWRAAKALVEQRLPRWQLLQRLLRQAADLPEGRTIQVAADAIHAQRSLLSDPDPTSPLISTLTGALRAALQRTRQAFVDTQTAQINALAQSDEWRQTADDEQKQLLVRHGLSAPPAVNIGTDEALLDELERKPLTTWASEIDALPARVANARAQAAKALQPAAVSLAAPHATLNNRAEVEAYLDQFRTLLLKHIDAGHPVIL